MTAVAEGLPEAIEVPSSILEQTGAWHLQLESDFKVLKSF